MERSKLLLEVLGRRTMIRWMSRRRALVCACLALISLWTGCQRHTQLRIAAGKEGGVVHRIGKTLAEAFDAHVEGVRSTVVEGEGKRDSLHTLVTGGAELAVAFSDAEDDHAGQIRTLVPLYELYMYIVIWDDRGVGDVPDLKGKKLGIGPEGSGTDALARRLLQHYHLNADNTTLVNERYGAVTKAFKSGELDALFILGSVESKGVAKALAEPGTKLLSLDNPERVAPAMDGIRSKHPYVVSHVIPKHLFGDKPKVSTGVIGVNALLVTTASFDETLAREVTRAVFANRLELGREVRRLRELTERFEPYELRFPLHPGASQYYRRDEPPAILAWADTISLVITVALLGWSGLLALAARRRRKSKTLLDELYTDFEEVIHMYDEEDETPPDEMTLDQLQNVRERLQVLRRRCFQALMSGSVEANNAFVVFNDYLRYELQEIERIQRDRRKERADLRAEA
jgi:TRAP transporter TAXI family solute receptor